MKQVVQAWVVELIKVNGGTENKCLETSENDVHTIAPIQATPATPSACKSTCSRLSTTSKWNWSTTTTRYRGSGLSLHNRIHLLWNILFLKSK